MHQPEARGETGRRVRFYVALGLVTAATLMLQIIETRIISVTSWYHLAFFVISIAMFGLTAGAVFVYLRPERFRPARLSYDLTVATARRNHSIAGQKRALPDPERVSLSEAARICNHPPPHPERL